MPRIFKSTVIDAPVNDVWELLRDFNGHDRWHPAVAVSEIEDGKRPDQVGCVRQFRLRDGGAIREQLLALSDSTRSFTYCILDAPRPLYDYVATVSLKPVTDRERTLWTWSCEFDAPAEREAELVRLVGEGIYEAGFAAVRSLLSGSAAVDPRIARVARAPDNATGTSPPRTSTRPTADAISAGAIVVHEYGGPEVLRWETVSAPPPGRGEVRLRQVAVGVNYIDVYCREGRFDLLSPPGVPGMEAAGEIIDVGPEVYGIGPGDRVGYACPPVGAYAEVRTMPAELLAVLPDSVSDETAAAGLLKGITAEFLLHRVHPVKPGEVVLVHAAAGGVGLLLCQWARALGATVIGTVGGAEKAALARENGCTYPVLYREEDFVEAVMDITDTRGADVVYDAVGRDTFEKSCAALAVHGHLVSYGQASGNLEPVDVSSLASKSATISRPNYGHFVSTSHELRAITDRLFDALRTGTIRIEVRQRYPLAEAAQAHRDLESRQTMGSTILTVDG